MRSIYILIKHLIDRTKTCIITYYKNRIELLFAALDVSSFDDESVSAVVVLVLLFTIWVLLLPPLSKLRSHFTKIESLFELVDDVDVFSLECDWFKWRCCDSFYKMETRAKF